MLDLEMDVTCFNVQLLAVMEWDMSLETMQLTGGNSPVLFDITHHRFVNSQVFRDVHMLTGPLSSLNMSSSSVRHRGVMALDTSQAITPPTVVYQVVLVQIKARNQWQRETSVTRKIKNPFGKIQFTLSFFFIARSLSSSLFTLPPDVISCPVPGCDGTGHITGKFQTHRRYSLL